jgi:hypothetical protein
MTSPGGTSECSDGGASAGGETGVSVVFSIGVRVIGFTYEATIRIRPRDLHRVLPYHGTEFGVGMARTTAVPVPKRTS